jgi:hypothetical protein
MLEYLLIGDLRELVEEHNEGKNSQWLLAVLDALLATLSREFELKEDGGYLADVLSDQPHWSTAVEQLRLQHGTLVARLQQLRDRVAWQAPLGLVAHLVRLELEDWITSLLAHQRHERRLVQTAPTLVDGAGD